MEFLGVVAEVVDVAVAGWGVVVEFVTSHAHGGGVEEGLDVGRRQVLRIVVGVLTLEVTTDVDGLEKDLPVGVLAISRTAGFPSVTVDDDVGVAGGRVVPVEDERLANLQFLAMKAPFSRVGSVCLRTKVKGVLCQLEENECTQLQNTTQRLKRHVQWDRDEYRR